MAEEKPKEKQNVFDKDMPAGMTKVFGKLGAKSWIDFLVMIAGIICIINVCIQWAFGYAGANGWKIVYFIIVLWVYVDTALYIKLGPFFASKFKNVSGAFSFLRDENDAKNFVVLIGAWTCVLDALSNAITFVGANLQNWVLWVYLPALVIFAIFVIKGKLMKK